MFSDFMTTFVFIQEKLELFFCSTNSGESWDIYPTLENDVHTQGVGFMNH